AEATRDLRFAGTSMIGVNCAACHVSELAKDGRTAVRIDGGPNLFDLSRFYGDLAQSTVATVTDIGELWAFLGRLRAPRGTEEAGEAASLFRTFPRFESTRGAPRSSEALAEQELARPADDLGKGIALAGRTEAAPQPPGTMRPEAFQARARKVLAVPPVETSPLETLGPAEAREAVLERGFADFVNTMRL